MDATCLSRQVDSLAQINKVTLKLSKYNPASVALALAFYLYSCIIGPGKHRVEIRGINIAETE